MCQQWLWTWAFLSIVLRLCSFHSIKHCVLCLTVLVRPVCRIQRCVRSILVTIAIEAVCSRPADQLLVSGIALDDDMKTAADKIIQEKYGACGTKTCGTNDTQAEI